jgi:hypothetical protein
MKKRKSWTAIVTLHACGTLGGLFHDDTPREMRRQKCQRDCYIKGLDDPEHRKIARKSKLIRVRITPL